MARKKAVYTDCANSCGRIGDYSRGLCRKCYQVLRLRGELDSVAPRNQVNGIKRRVHIFKDDEALIEFLRTDEGQEFITRSGE